MAEVVKIRVVHGRGAKAAGSYGWLRNASVRFPPKFGRSDLSREMPETDRPPEGNASHRIGIDAYPSHGHTKAARVALSRYRPSIAAMMSSGNSSKSSGISILPLSTPSIRLG